MNKKNNMPPDASAREQALQIRYSCIVQAPAGSGKTELLTHRFLKLLSQVDEPEDILAITFTRAATAEMRARILKALAEAHLNPVAQPGEKAMLPAARAVLQHSKLRGWRLLEQPQRLDIQTIDSLCMRIAHEQPMLARMGGHLQPTEDARSLYDTAARRTLLSLGNSNRELHEALLHLLQMRDNNLGDCQSLIASMLSQRDQWLESFPSPQQLTSDDWDELRIRLERPFQQAVRRTLHEAHRLLASEPLLANELMSLAAYACSNPNSIDLGLLATLQSIPKPEATFVEHWKCLCNLLLTDKNEWRKSFNKTNGFPPGKEGTEKKQSIKDLIDRFDRIPGLLSALGSIRDLPPAHYEEDQWQTLRHLFTILRHASAELRVVFAEQNTVDFIELNLAAAFVLEQEHPTERALAVSDRIRHLLVDEFQDTSRRQHRLLRMLLRAWNPGDGRTYFLVGDPMQSIYMFRQAEVELFHHIREHGIYSGDQHFPAAALQLTANFRSHAGLTEPLNEHFTNIFANASVAGAASVSFSPSEAIADKLPDPSLHIYPHFLRKDMDEASKLPRQEAEEALAIIQQYRNEIEAAISTPEASFTIAVLARSRQHLTLIAQLLRQHDVPFRSVELETLAERQEIRDLLSFTHALLHPMDRIAWLSVLRAPWSGLSLRDLHILCGEEEKQSSSTPILQLIEQRASNLSSEGQQRLQRVVATLTKSLATRYEHTSLSSWIERTWHTLGGPLCLDDEQRENVSAFFTMLDSIDPDGIACLSDTFDNLLSRLFAQPDPRASERAGVQLMTIHKSKGLGFDVVIVPGLERSTRRDPHPLIAMLERSSIDDPNRDELLLAPIGGKGDETHSLFRWVRKQRDLREAEERKRLFYVACTRARRELHLMGTALVTNGGSLRVPAKDSLLASAWPALQKEFEARYAIFSQQNVIPFPATAEPGGLDIAAAAVITPSHPVQKLKRLPAGVIPRPIGTNVTATGTFPLSSEESTSWKRPEGSRLQRTTGNIIHALLEQWSRSLAAVSLHDNEILTQLRPHAEAMLRIAAVPSDQQAAVLTDVLSTMQAVIADPQALWVLGPHKDAQSETSWTGWIDGALSTLRADRIFRAGEYPGADGNEFFWIVDYKTTGHRVTDVQAFLARERERYAPQLTQYGKALRKLHGESLPLRYALYFPRLKQLEYWSG